jgi:hypothetical protein
MIQPDLFSGAPLESPNSPRLAPQLANVYAIMTDGHWHGLEALAGRAACSECSASARLREIRKRFGRVIERKRVGPGLYWYRML